jgi:Dolichyl-phosphate-mannose-protein mannosyltransferase
MTVHWLKQPRTIIIIVFTFLALFLMNKALISFRSDQWRSVVGYEYYWIAESLAGGHGYSLPANHRWYFYDFKSEYPDDQYYPTALEEPVYPFLLFFAFKSLGEYGRLAMLLLNVVALFMTAVTLHLLVRKVFDSQLGIIASIALLTWWWTYLDWLTLGVFSPAILGGLNITLSAYLLLWSLEKVSVKRGIILGSMLAFSCLTLSAGMIFVPLAALFTLILKRPVKPLAWWPALAIVLTVSVILSPWTLRNYLVFGQVIPIRTGFGLALHQSNPALAATFLPETHASDNEPGPIWRAKNAKEAIDQARTVQTKRMAMYKRSYDYIESEAPLNYSEYNEAERDKVYFGKSIDFIISNPQTFLVLTRYRLQAFLVGWKSRHTLVALLAISGALMAWRNTKILILVILVAAYIFPFSIVGSWMYRYRYPIEPILFVISCGIPIIALSKIKLLIDKIRSPIIWQTTFDKNAKN